jgi:Protein of unknown function (DUF742).
MTDSFEFETRTVRPYAVTGGRVRSANADMPLEALVEVLPGAHATRGLTPEKRAILEHAESNYVSIAELSALLHLPLGVVKIIVADMAEADLVRVHSSSPMDVHTGQSPALSLSLLESVLNGISAL